MVVYSCQAHLAERLPALEAGWLQDLAAFGIDWVVVTGGAAPGQGGQRQGRHVALDCPDDYEGLPQKTLALLRWLAAQPRCLRAFKIDDDCFVDAGSFFGSLQPLKYDYYGRLLTRSRFQTDRIWHQSKSSSPRGRCDLDKSPEPSRYADGGSGYVLSRRAILAALDQAASPEGQRLISLSFMEDKMLGDLLARAGIALVSEGYYLPQERRAPGTDLCVPFWNNGPRPFAGSGIFGVHLDGNGPQQAVRAAARADLPQKDRIWPSYRPVRFGWASGQLVLLSAPARLAPAQAAEVAVVAVVRNEREMLPVFLAHYRALGVESFLIADNGSDDGSLDYLAAQPDVVLFSADSPYGLSHYGIDWQEALLSALRPGRWSLVADADELLIGSAPLPELIRTPEFSGADAARLFMLDLYPQGPLSEMTFTGCAPLEAAGWAERLPFLTTSAARGPFSDQPTWTSGLRHRLMPGSRPELFVAQKIALLRYGPQMQLSEGLHYVAGVRLAARDLLFGHFKYTASFAARVAREVARAQHFNGAEEYRRYQMLLAEGRERLWDPACSVPWDQSDFVRHLLDQGCAPGR